MNLDGVYKIINKEINFNFKTKTAAAITEIIAIKKKTSKSPLPKDRHPITL
ncbi:hypothetical protein [Fusobacterium ulcerans]|uniref:hypothetical protein n=1 Tax=Fusobacterium ulcerans TaxID=861 RepID=UPI001D0A9583|nr:hypothetical protein [Fusobacterium ulcerans]MCB8565779.1 hypothetical protein [Fusobacterium ulcerans]MCB8650649.1 hypothetical protein [Fusobacterium ulcerans]